MKILILASQSPSRKKILKDANIVFKAVASNYKEDMTLNQPPEELAIYLSAGKAREVAARVKNSLVIGADSFVVFEGKVIGKPHTNVRARDVLKMLSGKRHDLITGFTIIDTETGVSYSDCIVTKVYFRDLNNRDIENYIRTDNVLEKAGAYSFQGNGYKLIEKVDGDLSNFEGLPLNAVIKALKRFGYKIGNFRPT